MKIATCMKRYKPTIRCDRLFSSLCADSPRIDMRRQRRFVARLFSSLREHRQFNGPERKENGLKLLWKKDLFPFCGHFFFSSSKIFLLCFLHFFSSFHCLCSQCSSHYQKLIYHILVLFIRVLF